MTKTFPAWVMSVGKNAATIALDGEQQTRIADLKRSSGKREMLVPGDRVEVVVQPDGRAKVESVQPRSGVLARRTTQGRAKIMAANVDTIVSVTPMANPPPRTVVLDQLLAYGELEGMASILLFTKADLAVPDAVNELRDIYDRLRYTVLVANPKTGEGIESLALALRGRRALLAGVSGAGKSTTFRALGGDAVIGDVSRHGLGRQTTTASRLLRLGEDGFLIDSPGVAEFGLGGVAAGELVDGFVEFREAANDCRFSDCSHVHEPDCGVRAAVERGDIALSRYESYRHIVLAARVP